MLLRRCAWHKQYRGYGKLLGVSSWRGYGVAFSDGMCADCAARTREAWNLPTTSRPLVPSLGIPWATAAVALAAAAVISGIVVGPVERAVAPPAPSIAIAVDPPPKPIASGLQAEIPALPGEHAPRHTAAVAVNASAIFGPGDARAARTGPAARGRISRARGRATAPREYRSQPEPETPMIAALAEIDAEWSPNDVAVPAALVEETPPAALPHAVATPIVEAQAP